MRMSSLQLKRLIESEVKSVMESKRRSKRRPVSEAGFRPSLLSVIFEDVGDDIEAAYKGGPAAVRNLADTYPNKGNLRMALGGKVDSLKSDDRVKIKSGKVSVGGLLPTQSEIDLVQSIGWPLCDAKTLNKMITKKTSTAPGKITISGNLILDGHHRWSGVWSVTGPSGVVEVDDLALPGSQTDKLAASQLAIAAYKKPDVSQPAAAGKIELNILGKEEDAIYNDILAAEGKKDPKAPATILNAQYLEDCSKDPVIAKWAGFEVGADAATVKEKIARKTAQNLNGLPSNPEAPARADMPQFDHDSIGGKTAKQAIFGKLQGGDLNVLPPFKKGGKEAASSEDKEKDKEKQQVTADSWDRQGAVVVERWQRLAGLIK